MSETRRHGDPKNFDFMGQNFDLLGRFFDLVGQNFDSVGRSDFTKRVQHVLNEWPKVPNTIIL